MQHPFAMEGWRIPKDRACIRDALHCDRNPRRVLSVERAPRLDFKARELDYTRFRREHFQGRAPLRFPGGAAHSAARFRRVFGSPYRKQVANRQAGGMDHGRGVTPTEAMQQHATIIAFRDADLSTRPTARGAFRPPSVAVALDAIKAP